MFLYFRAEVPVLNCSANGQEEVYSGAYNNSILIKERDTFTACVRFSFEKLNGNNFVIDLHGSNTRPFYQLGK